MPKKRFPQTGPNTVDGKKNSSQNSLTHGVRSKRRVMPGERQEDFDRTREGWLREFAPEGYQEERLVGQLVMNDWFFQRAERWLECVQESMVTAAGEEYDPMEWSAEQEHKLELAQRYKTTAERAFYRSLNAARAVRQDRLRAEQGRAEQVRAEQEQKRGAGARRGAGGARGGEKDVPEGGAGEEDTAGLSRVAQVFRGQRAMTKDKKKRKLSLLEQWVEIEMTPEGTVTTLYPSNEELIKEGQTFWPPPDLVYRRLNFVDGVPPEYEWVGASEAVRERGGAGVQRMTAEVWLGLIEEEAALGTGHVGPCGGNLPRPEERGGCECEVCVFNRGVLEAGEGEVW